MGFQPLLGVMDVAAGFQHDNGDLCPVAALLQSLGSRIVIHAGGFADDALAPLHQLLVGGFHVHHQVAVDLAQLDHCAGGEHIQHHFLSGAALHASRAGDDLRPRLWGDADIRGRIDGGAGAAGPALEGGVVSTGMRADTGAVDEVKIRDGKILVHVIGNEDGEFQKMDSGNKSDKQEALKNGGKPLQIEAKGICGSGIIDLIAELFLEGWIDIRGKFSSEKSPLIQKKEGQWCVEYAPGLHFYQKDIDEFIRTKSAAHTMVEIMLRESGLELDQAERFYVAGAFGKHVSKESAITIGMYPDMDRDHIINAGNSSLEGAAKLLLNRALLKDIDQILEEMVYIQFAEVEDFLELMVAAQALPHTDFQRYPTVMKKIQERQAKKM